MLSISSVFLDKLCSHCKTSISSSPQWGEPCQSHGVFVQLVWVTSKFSFAPQALGLGQRRHSVNIYWENKCLTFHFFLQRSLLMLSFFFSFHSYPNSTLSSRFVSTLVSVKLSHLLQSNFSFFECAWLCLPGPLLAFRHVLCLPNDYLLFKPACHLLQEVFLSDFPR